MNRRNFVSTTMAAGSLPFMMAASMPQQTAQEGKELYEIRTYEIKFRARRKLLEDYLLKVLGPSLKEKGANHFTLLGELGMADPSKLWVFISYPTAEVYMQSQLLYKDPAFVSAAADYNNLDPESALFTRYESSLLLAFDGMPQMKAPKEGAAVFELRTYEGYSEDAVRRKIKMFNEGEIDLFLQTGLDPVFFGEMISGPYRPCLTYMLNFKDMKERDENWQKFGSHPGWKEMSALEEYANTVSNIRRIFLTPLG